MTDLEIGSLLNENPNLLNEKLNGMYPWEIAFANDKFVRTHALLTMDGATVKKDSKFLPFFQKKAEEKLEESNNEERRMWEEINRALNQQ